MDSERRAIRYRKIGGGSLRLGKRIIKPNQEFYAYEDEIPPIFLQRLQVLDKVEDKEHTAQTCENACNITNLEIQARGSGWFDIVNTVSGKKLNEQALRVEEAYKLLKELVA